MNQTFYIDIDEEISSVIDRLKKSVSAENYFVVPKRALFVQSIINLKLLKREAEKLKKRVLLVTQDEFAINMAEKAGLEVKNAPEGIENSADSEGRVQPTDLEQSLQNALQEVDEPAEVKPDSLRLRAIGSEDFYGKEKKEEPLINSASRGPQTSSIPVYTAGDSRRLPPIIQTTRPAKMSTPTEKNESARQAIPIRRPMPNDITLPPKQPLIQSPRPARESQAFAGRLDSSKEKSIEKMFAEQRKAKAEIEREDIPVKVGGRGRKIILMFIVLCAIAFVGVATYVFVPSATVGVNLDTQKKVVSTELAGSVGASAGIDGGAIVVPLRIIEKEDSVSLTYDTTGTSASSSSKKAQGSVVIYNAFSNSPQTLIATTRIQTGDGKVFRLVKTVTVPGMSGSGSDAKPGAIAADVVADQLGEAYNIDSTTFTIPGFEGSPKFDKFSAKSTSAMTGGTGDSNGPRAISEKDIADAKTKAENALKEKLQADISAEAQKNEVVLEGAEKFDVSNSSAAGKVGTVGDTFSYAASGTMTALVFSASDVAPLVESLASKDLDAKKFAAPKLAEPSYSNVSADFEAKTLKANVDAQATLVPLFDATNFKGEIAGKNESQLKQIVSQTFGIKNVNIEFFPPFATQIPKFSQRITVKVNTGE